MEMVFFDRLPGYSLLRSLTQRMAGDSDEHAWQPALVEIEDQVRLSLGLRVKRTRGSDEKRVTGLPT